MYKVHRASPSQEKVFCTKYIEQAEVMSKVYVGIMRPAQVTLAAAI